MWSQSDGVMYRGPVKGWRTPSTPNPPPCNSIVLKRVSTSEHMISSLLCLHVWRIVKKKKKVKSNAEKSLRRWEIAQRKDVSAGWE